jgi:HAMP domain-containing protein
MAWINYTKMNKSIIEGFNTKLTAISSTTGSFIDGDAHQKLSIPKYVKAFAYNSKEDILYGVDKKNYLLKINLKSGAGVIFMKLDLNVNDLTYNSNDGYLYASTPKDGIIVIDLEKRLSHQFIDIKENIYGLTYLKKNNRFVISTQRKLLTIDEESKEIKPLKRLKRKIDSLGYNPKKELLYGVYRESNQLLTIEMKNLELKRLSLKKFPNENSDLYAIEFNKNKLFAGIEQLMIYNLTDKKTKYKDFALGFRDEGDAVFKKYISSMNKIKVETGLTYHYSQELIYGKKDVNCRYILDVSIGNEYTPIGSEDIMSREDIVGAEDVILRGKIYVSKIKKWKKWGLLKVSFAPIYNKNGEIKAIAGADINMEIIKKKRREAFVKSILTSILFLIIGIIASYTIAKNIIEPIRKLKYSTLKVAAGKYGDEIFIKSPKELKELSSEFNYMSQELKNRMTDLNRYSKESKSQRVQLEISKKMDKERKIIKNRRVIKFLNTNSIYHDYVEIENKLYFWLSDTKINWVTQPIIKEIIKHSVAKNSDDFYKEFQLICKDDISLFGYVDIHSNREKSNGLLLKEISIENKIKINLTDLSYDKFYIKIFNKNGVVIDISSKENLV